jgi:hypothetical protein
VESQGWGGGAKNIHYNTTYVTGIIDVCQCVKTEVKLEELE